MMSIVSTMLSCKPTVIASPVNCRSNPIMRSLPLNPHVHMRPHFECRPQLRNMTMMSLRPWGVRNNETRIQQSVTEILPMTKAMENYGKLSSEAYGIWFPEKNDGYEDTDFYKRYIKSHGQPALEIGCGDGRLLVPFVSEGLDVEGLDLSPYMLEQCQKRAASKGLSVTLHHQAMEEINLKRKYATIFIPYGSFMLVNQQEKAQTALRKFNEHLLPKGNLIVPLFNPTLSDIHVSAPEQGKWRLRREGARADGAVIKCWEKAGFNLKEQLETSEYRYEVLVNGQIVATENEILRLRWYTQDQFHQMLKKAGFAEISCFSGYSSEPAKNSDSEFTFVAKKH